MDEIRHPTPRQIGSWALEERLGQGAFGAAWKATDPSGRTAVVKLLPDRPGDELRALTRIRHPSVVAALDAGSQPRPYLVMELAPGAPLSERLRAGPMPEADALGVVAVIADALASCHAAGIAHGDVKPANLVWDERTHRVTLVDFGLAGRIGGTVLYAAPEILAGGRASAPADVYALGAVAWELLHGSVPWRDHWPGGRPAPEPTAGPEWVRSLLTEMLAPSPATRPTAAAVADAFDGHGIPIAGPTAEEVSRRAAAVFVRRPTVQVAVDRWLEEGESLAVTGPVGSGRTHLLDRVADELRARGQPFARLTASGPPWSAVETVLADPGLPGPPLVLPEAADVLSRVDAVAAGLRRRFESRVVLLVDDVDDLDEGSRSVVEACVRTGSRVLVTAREAVTFVAKRIHLGPLGPDQSTELLQGLLGPVEAAVVASHARAAVGALPADLVRYALAAVRAGALVWRRRRWVVDEAGLEAVGRSADLVGRTLPHHLPATTRRLGGVIAHGQPIERHLALEVAEAGPEDLGALVDGGWVRGRQLLVCASETAAAALKLTAPDPVDVHRRLLDAWLASRPVPWARVGAAVLGARDVDLARSEGARCVRAALDLDVGLGVRLAEGLAALAGTPELAAARIEALVRAGRGPDARQAGASWLERADADAVPVWIALARLEDATTEDPAAILALVDRARGASKGDVPDALRILAARALFRARRLEESDALCEALTSSPDAETALAAWGLLAQVRAQSRGPEPGLQALQQVPAELGVGTAGRALLEGIRGRLLWMAGRPRDAARAMEAGAAARRSVSLVDRSRLENNAALCWYTAGDAERAVTGWERALLGFERVGADLEAVRVLVNLCQGFRDLGRWRRAVAAGEDAVARARRHGARAFEAVALGNLGDVAMWRKNYAEADRHWESALALARSEALDGELVELHRRRAELAVLRRDRDALERIDEAEGLATASGAEVEVARCQALRAVVHARRGHEAPAREAAAAALGDLRRVGAAGELALARLWVAEAWLALRLPEEARAEAEQAARYAEEFARPPLRTWAERILVWARVDRGEHERLERLTELAVRVSSHVDLDDLLRELASTAVELLDAERAFVLLMEDGRPTVVASAGADAEQRPPSTSVVRRALSLGREVVVTDMEERADLRVAESVVAMALKAAICVPLSALDGDPVGVLYLDSREQPVNALGDGVVMLRALAAHASVALRHARQTSAIRANERRAREIAHDLRNPLGVGLMLADEMLETGQSLTVDDVRILRDALQHAADLVERSLARENEPVTALSWDEAVTGWMGAMHRQTREQGVRLLLRAQTGAVVRGIPTELRRAVTNLLVNALKYAPAGTTVWVSTTLDGTRAGLEVRDQGPGVPDHVRERIFESGVQGPQALPGYGLGLAIVRRIAEEHGGGVEASNHPQGGACFRFWIDGATVGALAI